jgi:hypothetical protein
VTDHGDAAEHDADHEAAEHDAAEHDAAEHDAAEHDAAEHDAAEHDAAEHDAADPPAPGGSPSDDRDGHDPAGAPRLLGAGNIRLGDGRVLGGGSVGRRYGPLAGILAALVVMAGVVAVGNGDEPAGANGGDAPAQGNAQAPADPNAEFTPEGVTPWSVAEERGTTDDIDWGERCDTERGTMAYPLLGAPECFAPFDGDNGGATAPGVTGDTVTVVLYQPQEHDPILDYITGAIGAADSNADVAKTLQDWTRFYETFFETYGRHVDLIPYTATGVSNDDVAARADATQIAEQYAPFAVIGGPILSSAFGDALVSRRILCIDCMPVGRDDYLERHSPYIATWHIGPDQADRHVAEFIGKQLEGRKAVHAGDRAFQRKTRRFGVVYLSNGQDADDLGPFEDALGDQGVTIDQAVAYASPVDLQRDAPALIARLRAAGDTSVIFIGDPVAPQPLTTAATAQGYFPEWILVGAGFTDATLFGRTYDQRQWAHAFGVTFLPARVDPRNDDTNELYRWFFGHRPPAGGAGLTLLDVQLLYAVLQGAGPDLTPHAFQQALFAAPPSPRLVTSPQLSWGDHDVWPTTDHAGIDDATVVWWNPDARGPDEAGRVGRGMYEYVDGGRRFLPGEWPTEALPLFEGAHAVALYERPPGAADVPEYPVPPAAVSNN